jgi:hypothetical protein
MLLASGWASTEMMLYREVLPGIPWFWRHISLSFHNAIVHFGIGWEHITEPAYRRLVLVVNAVMMMGVCALVYTRWKRVRESPALMMVFSYQWLIAFVPLLEMIHVSWALPALFVGLREWAERRVGTVFMLPWALSWAILVNIDILGSFAALALGAMDNSHLVMTLIVAQSLLAVSVYTLFSRSDEPTA